MAVIGSNSGRYTLCPYYRWDFQARITCEDTYRRFDSTEDRSTWMDMYCDSDWTKCPFAVDLTEAYARLEKGDEKALENHEIEALRKELKGMATKLGRAEKRVERQQKKIDELRSVNQSLVRNSENVSTYFRKWREAQAKLDQGEEKIMKELSALATIYEQRMAYLIDVYAPGKVIYEDDVEDWARDRAFAIVHDEEGGRILWQVKFEEKKDAKDTDKQGSANKQAE